MSKCLKCNKDYNNYEDVSFMAGHGMCVDCYEDRNNPNKPSLETEIQLHNQCNEEQNYLPKK